MPFTEENYENSVIELFKDMGYTHLYGPDVERDYYKPLYESELERSLRRINPKLPDAAIADALYKLHNFENADLPQKNSVFMKYLQNGVEVSYLHNGEQTSDIVYLIDYQTRDNNSFIVANQWTYIAN